MPFNRFHLKQPARLLAGDALGVIAPSSPFDKNLFFKGVHILKEMGFRLIFPDRLFEQKDYLAGSDVHRAEMFNAMFSNPDVKGIICARGGYGALRILPLIDYSAISLNPKLLIGCSDITVLLNTLYSKCGLLSLHGPMIESLSRASEQTMWSLRDMLLNEQGFSIVCENPMVIHSGAASGIMAGGNLTTLCHLVGTPFEPDFSGQILLLEDIGESPYRIDRMLVHMKMAGCFDHIAGLVLGSFKGCGEPEVVFKIFEEIFSNDPIPILAGFAIGHDEPNLTIPFGIRASLDTENGNLSFSKLPFVES